ncbi:MAG: hypothetical protein MUC97_10955 [Bernardetiaceae bacterium]|jgi:hypothetical protein|nr:hypothetical protein [Bernardetiaceae bacterium]
MKKLVGLLMGLATSGALLAQPALRFDGGQPANRPFYQPGQEISRILIEAAKAGRLPVYDLDFNDQGEPTAARPLAVPVLVSRVLINPASRESEEWLPKEIRVVGLATWQGERYLSLFVPPDVLAYYETPDQGRDRYEASFKWADCERVLDTDPRAVWLPRSPARFGPWLHGSQTQQLSGFLRQAAQDGKIVGYLANKSLPVNDLRTRVASHPPHHLTVAVRDSLVGPGQFKPVALGLLAENPAQPGQITEVARFRTADFENLVPDSLWQAQPPARSYAEALRRGRYLPLNGQAETFGPPANTIRPLRQQLTGEIVLSLPSNQGVFAKKRELTARLVEGVRRGKLTAYTRLTTAHGDSLVRLPPDSLRKELTDPATGQPYPAPHFSRLAWEDEAHLVDGQLSYQPQYLGLIFPAELTKLGLDRVVAWFKTDEAIRYLRQDRKARYKDKTRRKNRRRNYADFLAERDFTWHVYEQSPVQFAQ